MVHDCIPPDRKEKKEEKKKNTDNLDSLYLGEQVHRLASEQQLYYFFCHGR